MSRIFRFLWNIFFWTYSRGSWQWDLAVIAFLMAIFLTPASFLTECTRNPMSPEEIQQALLHFLGW